MSGNNDPPNSPYEGYGGESLHESEELADDMEWGHSPVLEGDLEELE